MNRSHRTVALAILVSSWAFGGFAGTDDRESITMGSYQRARTVLDQAITAAGGMERIAEIQTLDMELEGIDYLIDQSPVPGPPYATTPRYQRYAVDFEREWVFDDNRTEIAGGIVFSGRAVIRGDTKLETDAPIKRYRYNDKLDLRSYEFLERLFPPLMLSHALDQARSLRWLGEAVIDGKKQDVIIFSWYNGTPYTLYLDPSTHLLTRYESLFPDPGVGDAVGQTTYTGYRAAGGLMLPTGFTFSVSGTLARELAFTRLDVNRPLDESLFEVPEGYQEVPYLEIEEIKVEKLAEDVYLLMGLGDGYHNVLFVAFDDYVLVVDTPSSSSIGAQALEVIHKTIPDKPVRYAVVTHHHLTHTGGVRPFIAAGVRLVTTPDSRAIVERLAKVRRTLDPDALSESPREPQIEVMEGDKRVFSDGEHRVEILDFGPNPHAEQLLVAYLPEEKILFQPDLLQVQPPPVPVSPAWDATVGLARKIEELGLDVEVLIGTHGRIGSMADLQAALDSREAAVALRAGGAPSSGEEPGS